MISKVHVVIKNDIEVESLYLPQALLKRIKKDLTLDNPAYTKLQRLGKTGNSVDLHIKLYHEENGRLVLPRGYGQTLFQYFREYQVNVTYQDLRLQIPEIEFKHNIKLRDYQRPAVQVLYKNRQGGIVAPCSAGKTIIGISTIVCVKQPTLWITHSQELANQFIERLRRRSPL